MKPLKPNVYIKGIYSTALTKMFIDAGYPIVFPSKETQKRFRIQYIPKNNYSKDITIQDRIDRQGVSIMFKKKVWDDFNANNFKDFPLSQEKNPNFIIHHAKFHKNSIYRGLIVKSNRQINYSKIRLASEDINTNGMEKGNDFHTNVAHYSRFIQDSKEGIFQVTHEDCGQIQAKLGSFFTIPGNFIVIAPYDNRVIISKKITNGRQKKRLFDLGKSIQQSKKYGFIFRTAAGLVSNDQILEEVEELESNLIETQNTITQFPDRIGKIFSNFRSMNVIFPAQVKNQFDDIRNSILPTMELHHTIKSIKKQRYRSRSQPKKSDYYDQRKKSPLKDIKIPQMINFTEHLLENTSEQTKKEITNTYLDLYYDQILHIGRICHIIHFKLNGKTINLSYGRIQSVQKFPDLRHKIVLKRNMHSGGLYDGLNTPIEDGDYAISEYILGNWYYTSIYYSRNGERKGRYININTPIEINSEGIRYIDLEIDVVENMVGDRKIIDQDKLEKAFQLGIISDEIKSKALTLSENILEGRIE